MKKSKETIPLVRPTIGKEELRAVTEVLHSGWLAHGPKNKELEAQIQKYFKVKHCIVVNSGASALYAALRALDIRGEVIVPSMTMAATANAIVAARATPVFCDVEYETLNLDPKDINRKITKKTKAIMPVHFAGQTCNMTAIMNIAKKYKLKVIEDSAQTFGGRWDGKYAGTFGDVGCFSFWPSKGVTTGEGGAIITNNKDVALKVRAIAAHGIQSSTLERKASSKPWHRDAVLPGFNFRMSNIAAAIGVEQMKKIKKFNIKRRKLSYTLRTLLKEIPGLEIPDIAPKAHHVFQMFIVRVPKSIRDDIVLALRARGIEASVHFDPPVHQQTFYRKRYKASVPVTTKLSKEIITLPMFPSLTDADLRVIAKTLREVIMKLQA